MDYRKLADLLFPNLKYTVEDIEKKYSKRNLNDLQVVSRYAPSPTGLMHIGNFLQMFISYNLVRVTDGVFFLRIEDTDSKREKEGSLEVIYDILNRFGIKPHEYYDIEKGIDVGEYGPYKQSQRVDIYKAYAKKLVSEGKAFPCFCVKTEGKDDVLKLREDKFTEDDQKEYDPCRDMSYEEVEKRIKNGEKFAIRLRTKNDGSQRVKFYDLIKGEIEAKANAKDFILLKNDFVPPYAFAHAIDDTLMGTTIVVRGEEYISSTPMHIELFEALGFKQVTYCHNPLIWKIGDNGNKRKISKRYDPEFKMSYYFEQGYPIESVFEYLLNIINSGFEEWRAKNPTLNWREFTFGINDITMVAPVFDMVKLNDVSKNIIAKMTAEEVYDNVLNWAEEYDKEFYLILKENKEFAIKVFSIDRGGDKPRKDIARWSEVKDYFDYMFIPYKYLQFTDILDEKITKNVLKNVMNKYSENYNENDDKQTWFNKIKESAEELGFCTNNKEYKLNPDNYLGNTAKFCAIIRVVVTGRMEGPDLYSICNVLGKDEINKRICEYFNF